MNCKLSDAQIAAAVQTLRNDRRRVSWRSLRAMLIKQYGVAGRTDRLRAVCRTLQQPAGQGSQIAELRRQAEDSERRQAEAQRERDLALARARRSEERETAHQDRWAAEIYALRESVERLKGERARRQTLEDQVVRLQRELQALYSRLARYEG